MSLNQAHLPEFGLHLANAKKITVLTGAGVSAESGIPTFRGQGGLWRTWSAMDLATTEAFQENPSLVWEFYHYRRCVVDKALPNAAHYALAALQQHCKKEGKTFTLLTQNIDELHMRSGSEDVVELHGSLWKTRCTKCSSVQENRDMPICAALDGRGAPDPATPDARIPVAELPHCKLCKGLLRPHVVWFGENLFSSTLGRAHDALQDCDLLLVAGTSALVWPAAGYAPMVSSRGGKVAEFNIVDTPASPSCKFKFRGPSASTLPEALGIPLDQLPGTSTLDSSKEASIGNSGGSCSVYFDHQEFAWLKLQVLKDKYLQDMKQLHGMLTERCKLPMPPEQLRKLQLYAAVLQRMIPYLTVPKERLPRDFTHEKIYAFEKQMLSIMDTFKRRRQTGVQPPLVLPQEQLQSDQAPQPQPAQQEAQWQEQQQPPLSQIEDGIKQMEL